MEAFRGDEKKTSMDKLSWPSKVSVNMVSSRKNQGGGIDLRGEGTIGRGDGLACGCYFQ